MPFVHIQLVKGVLKDDIAAKKATISRAVVDAINEQTGLAKDLVWVVFEEVPTTEWFVGEKSVEQIWKERDGR
jgi:phenylpyruvate tautomerase PptA (4-oxalocrotonate tautomerase family)